MSRRAGNPFRASVVLGMLVVGAAAFLLMLYAMAQGWDGTEERNGGAHARSNALNGFSGLVALSNANGFSTELGYSAGRFDEYPLMVLTPQHYANAEELDAIITQRRYAGPTIVILPKWHAMPVPNLAGVEHEPGWVILGSSAQPDWFDQLEFVDTLELQGGQTAGWFGFGMEGALPEPEQVQAIAQTEQARMRPLVVDSEGDFLAVEIDHPYDDDAWSVTFVLEPDLLNNYGLADQERAQMALYLLEEASWDTGAIIFDLSIAGLGKSENLLTLIFSPPFLAATLCLLLACLVIGWRAFRRFGPPVLATPVYAQGKKALANNGAGLIGRVKRWHLLAEPYAELVIARLAKSLAIRNPDPDARIRAIDEALERAEHQGPRLEETVKELRDASHPRDILRGANILRDMERTLKR